MATGFVDRGKGKVLVGNVLYSVQANITAHAGGLMASATPLSAQNCFVSVVATAGDSLLLPPAQIGMELAIINQVATAANIFSNGTDTINAGASGGAAIAAGASFLISATSITMSVNNPGYVIPGMSVFDLTITGGGLLLGTVTSWSTSSTTLNISAAAHASQGSADSLLFGASVSLPASSALIFYCATTGSWWSH
jgi:hypothetical protein